jgi:hypothetical protein
MPARPSITPPPPQTAKIQLPHPTTPAHAFNPPYDAKAVTQPGGSKMFSHADGRHWEVNRDGHLTHFSKPGTEARFAENGRVVQAHVVRPDHSEITVKSKAYGQRYEVVRPDHTRFVGYGARRGYMERPITARPGYVSRTYVVGKRTYARVYQAAKYRNVVYYRYMPAYHYSPAYYQWADDPWSSPMASAWDWGQDQWSSFWNSYFSPDPSYPNASAWLTDYMLGENLRQAYDDRQAASADDQSPAPPPAAAGTPPALTPAIKQELAGEVRQQLAAERAAASQPAPALPKPGSDQPPPALDPKIKTFVVSQAVEMDTGGQSCQLTPGDVILRTSDLPVEQTKVSVMAISSKPGSCAVSTKGLLEIADLQEMYNDFREHIDDGLKLLADKQGKDGVPAGPAADPRQVPAGTAVPDLYAETELTQQQKTAEQTITDVELASAGT